MGIELAQSNLSKEVKTFGNAARSKNSANGLDFLDALNQSAPAKPIAIKNSEKIETPIKAVTNPKAKVQNSDRDAAGQINVTDVEEGESQPNPNLPVLLVSNEILQVPNANMIEAQNNGSIDTSLIDISLILSQANIQANGQGQVPLVANDGLGAVANDKQSAIIGTGSAISPSDTEALLLKGAPQTAAEVTNGANDGGLEAGSAPANQTPNAKDSLIMASLKSGEAIANPAQNESAKIQVSKLDDSAKALEMIGMGTKTQSNKEVPIQDLDNSFAQSNNGTNSQSNSQANNRSNNNSGGQNQNSNPLIAQSGQKILNNAAKTAELKANEIKAKNDLNAVLPEIVDSFGSALDQLSQNGTTSMDAPMATGQTSDSVRINMSALAAMIARRHLNGEKSIFVRLDPAELGGVRIELKFGANKKLSAIINVEKADALRELSNNSANLLQSLRDSGLEVAENAIEFQLDNAPNQQEQSQSWAGEYRKSHNIGQIAENNDEAIIGKTEPNNQSIKMPHLEIWKRARISLEA